MADPKSFESAISYLDAASEHYRKAGVDESIKQLELSEMSYPEARNRIYGILYKANNVLTDELFKGSERFDTNKNAALVNLCEACLQIAYANSVIEAARSAKQP